jgi:hypothetical protein
MNHSTNETGIVERCATGATAIDYFAQHWNDVARTDWKFAAPLAHAYTPPSRTMIYDNDNRLATVNGNNVTIDGQGNMTYGPGTNNTFGYYSYDAQNRLTSAGGLTYGYDSAGNRTSLTNGSTNENFVIDPKTSQVLMRIKPGVTNYYIYGAGLLYEIDATASTRQPIAWRVPPIQTVPNELHVTHLPCHDGEEFSLIIPNVSTQGPPTSSAVQVNQENSGADHRRLPANRVRGAAAFGSINI